MATLAVSDSETSSPSDAQTYWAEYLSSVLGRLFEATEAYSPDEQAAHLQLMRDHIAPLLGPLPSEPHPRYTPPASLVGAPVDFSLNFTSTDRPRVRMDLDLLSRNEGYTGPDSFALAAAREASLGIAATVGGDTQWMTTLLDSLTLSSTETKVAFASVPADQIIPPGMIGFDFDGPRATMKGWVPAMHKAIATRSSSAALYSEALKRLAYANELAPGLAVIESYLAESPYSPSFVLVGIDLVTPRRSRVKCYLHVGNNSFAAVRDCMTLGGRLDGPVSRKRMELLESIWPLLVNDPEALTTGDETRTTTEKAPSNGFSGIMCVAEVSVRQTMPDTKLYVPLFQYNDSAIKAERNFELVLQKLGMEWGFNGKYSSTMASIFGNERRDYGQLYATFAYTEGKGAYTTSYFSKVADGKAGLDYKEFKYV